MFDDVDEFKKKAIDNKNDIKRESVDIIIGEDEQSFRISGIGEKAVKIEKYFRYEDIFKAVEDELNLNLLKRVYKKFLITRYFYVRTKRIY